MKKYFIFCFAVMALLVSLTGCRGNSTNTTPTPIVSTSPSIAPTLEPSPSDNAGDKDNIIDDAIDDAKDGLQDAGHAVEDAADDLLTSSPDTGSTKSRMTK